MTALTRRRRTAHALPFTGASIRLPVSLLLGRRPGVAGPEGVIRNADMATAVMAYLDHRTDRARPGVEGRPTLHTAAMIATWFDCSQKTVEGALASARPYITTTDTEGRDYRVKRIPDPRHAFVMVPYWWFQLASDKMITWAQFRCAALLAHQTHQRTHPYLTASQCDLKEMWHVRGTRVKGIIASLVEAGVIAVDQPRGPVPGRFWACWERGVDPRVQPESIDEGSPSAVSGRGDEAISHRGDEAVSGRGDEAVSHRGDILLSPELPIPRTPHPELPEPPVVARCEQVNSPTVVRGVPSSAKIGRTPKSRSRAKFNAERRWATPAPILDCRLDPADPGVLTFDAATGYTMRLMPTPKGANYPGQDFRSWDFLRPPPRQDVTFDTATWERL